MTSEASWTARTYGERFPWLQELLGAGRGAGRGARLASLSSRRWSSGLERQTSSCGFLVAPSSYVCSEPGRRVAEPDLRTCDLVKGIWGTISLLKARQCHGNISLQPTADRCVEARPPTSHPGSNT